MNSTVSVPSVDDPTTRVELPLAELSANARTVLARRYLKKDAAGKPVEEPEEMFWRVAYVIAREDAKYGAGDEEIEDLAREFYLLMARRLFEPNSPTLMNAGRPLGQLSACFVLPVEDALSNGKTGIYDTLRSMALVHQSGGGTGFSFSRLRPSGDIVKSTTGVASGPVSFMSLYDASTEVVKQGGTRRGANMGILRVDHPDILEFIDCKQDITRITNFNISVAITDSFMRAVEAGEEYELYHPRSGAVAGSLDARVVFDKIVQNAWNTGEPGVYFIDRANFYNPVPHLGTYEATNPCGEQPLLPFDVCNLGSVNVGAFVRTDVESTAPWYEKIDWKEYRRVVRLSTHFLDNVIDANQFPLPEIHDLAHRIRRIGLGVMGFADLLVRLGVPYDSEEGVEVGRRIMEFLDEEAKKESENLAGNRGAFPEWERSIWGPDATCARAPNGDRIRRMRRLRNCNVDTVAPTGTISIIAGCASGIEPLFAVAFMRNQAGVLMPDVNDEFVAVARERGFYSEELMKRIAEQGHIHFPEVPADVQRVYVTAHDITPEWHVRMQAAFQEYTDSAISKTTNFPHEANADDVRQIYELAFKLNCKGVTVYRDGSRDNQVLSTGATKTPAQQAADANQHAELKQKIVDLQGELKRAKERAVSAESQVQQVRRQKRKRPLTLRGTTRKMNSPLGDVYVTINEDEGSQPFEVFATLGKAGSIAMADTEAIGRLISLALRFGIPVSEVHQQLRGISSDRAVGFGQNKVLSVPDAIAQAIEMREQEKAGIQQELIPDLLSSAGRQGRAEAEAAGGVAEAPLADEQVNLPRLNGYDASATFIGTCPDCQSQLEMAEGCMKCHVCGFSECG